MHSFELETLSKFALCDEIFSSQISYTILRDGMLEDFRNQDFKRFSYIAQLQKVRRELYNIPFFWSDGRLFNHALTHSEWLFEYFAKKRSSDAEDDVYIDSKESSRKIKLLEIKTEMRDGCGPPKYSFREAYKVFEIKSKMASGEEEFVCYLHAGWYFIRLEFKEGELYNPENLATPIWVREMLEINDEPCY